MREWVVKVVHSFDMIVLYLMERALMGHVPLSHYERHRVDLEEQKVRLSSTHFDGELVEHVIWLVHRHLGNAV